MPRSLREVMEDYRRSLIQGMLSPGSREDHPDHWQHPEGEYGSAARRTEQDARELVAAVDQHHRLSEIVRRFGTVAHWVADVNDPLHAADRDPNLPNYYRDFQAYLEGVIRRSPLVFKGYRSPTLAAEGPGAYMMESAARSRQYAGPVRRSYRPDGGRISAEAFDERSLAFGVGSLSYSYAVNDIARVWLWAWEACHGDTMHTPFPLDPVSQGPPEGRAKAAEERSP